MELQRSDTTQQNEHKISKMSVSQSILLPQGTGSYQNDSLPAFHLTSAYSRSTDKRIKGVFTPSQWQELEHQALIYKFLLAGVSIPSDLINPLRKTLNSSAAQLRLHSSKESGRSNIQEWALLMTSFMVESLSSYFEQLNHPIMAMIMAISGLIVCIVEIVLKARRERVSVEWMGYVPWLYSHYPNYKLFGSTIQNFGLVVAIWQCFHACLGFFYARKGLENPIKMTITMFLFCMCLIISKIVKNYSKVHPSRRENP